MIDLISDDHDHDHDAAADADAAEIHRRHRRHINVTPARAPDRVPGGVRTDGAQTLGRIGKRERERETWASGGGRRERPGRIRADRPVGPARRASGVEEAGVEPVLRGLEQLGQRRRVPHGARLRGRTAPAGVAGGTVAASRPALRVQGEGRRGPVALQVACRRRGRGGQAAGVERCGWRRRGRENKEGLEGAGGQPRLQRLRLHGPAHPESNRSRHARPGGGGARNYAREVCGHVTCCVSSESRSGPVGFWE